jgi:predicted PurR-regulated permease PerM
MSEHEPEARRSVRELTRTRHRRVRRRIKAGAQLVGVVLAALVLWHGFQVLFLVFASLLCAVLLRSLGDFVSEHTGLPEGRSLALVVLVLLGALAGSIWLAAPDVAAQFDEMTHRLPRSVRSIEQQLSRYGWARAMFADLPETGHDLIREARILQRAPGVLFAAVGVLGIFAVFLALGLFIAAEPAMYKRGIVRLVPPGGRKRADEILSETWTALSWWVLGQVCSMLIIGTLTALGLWLLGMPLVLLLSLLAMLLTFIPNIGPALALVPAVLLGLMDGPRLALYVLVLYLGVQLFETYLVTPLIMRRAVRLPPALLISLQLLFGLLWGGMGLVLAAPLTVAGMVLVQRLYIEGVLGEELLTPATAHEGT